MVFAQLTRFFVPTSAQQTGSLLYCEAVKQARQPVYYTHYQVSDTLDGRFDLILLQVFLLSRALARITHRDVEPIRQEMVNSMFQDMDQSLREMGVGDVSIGKKVQKMAYALNGRMDRYESSWSEAAALEEAVWRNLYRADPQRRAQASDMTQHIIKLEQGLLKLPEEDLLRGIIKWPKIWQGDPDHIVTSDCGIEAGTNSS